MDKQRISQLVKVVRDKPAIEVRAQTSRADKVFDEVYVSQRRRIEETMSEWDKWKVYQNCKDIIETMGQYIKVYL